MKRLNSESDLLTPVEKDQGESEFAQAFRRVKKQTSTENGEKMSSELFFSPNPYLLTSTFND